MRSKINTFVDKLKEKLQSRKRTISAATIPLEVDKELEGNKFHNEEKLADRYRKLHLYLEDGKKKLERLYSVKDHISIERFESLEKEYKDIIAEIHPLLEDVKKLVDSKIVELIKQLEKVGKDLADCENLIQQEEKLYEVSAITKDEYNKKIRPLKINQKNLKTDFNKIKKKVDILKNSLYTSLVPEKKYKPDESHHFASFGSRLVALIFDGIILLPISIASFLLPIVGPAIAVVGSCLYFTFTESSEWQATIGKRMMGIKVVDMYGNKISQGTALLRYLGKSLSSLLLCLGYFLMLFTDNSQCLHDLIANTLVTKR